MGKMKEIFMKENYPNEDRDYDIEREHYIDYIIAQEREYLEYEKLKKDAEMNYNFPLQTKIEINERDYGEKQTEGTRIKVESIRNQEINKEKQISSWEDEALWL